MKYQVGDRDDEMFFWNDVCFEEDPKEPITEEEFLSILL